MKGHWGKAKPDKEDMLDQLDDINPVASAMDCTGIIQTLPLSEDEIDSYAAISDMPKPRKKTNVLNENHTLEDYYLWPKEHD
jgi:hypothetical protein